MGSLSAPLGPQAGSDPDVVWGVRLDWARNEAGSLGLVGFGGSANEKGNLGGECGRPIVTSGDFVAIIKDVNKKY